jgi:serine/threonine protein kinase
MSDNAEKKVTDNSNEWIENAISKKPIESYEFEQFHNIQEIGFGSFGKVYRASCNHKYYALKSFSFNNTTAKEIVHEVITVYNKYTYCTVCF